MEYSVVVVAAVAMSFIVSFFIITIGCPLSIRYGLVDMPGGRKLHSGSVPLIGGLGIFFGVFISSAIFGTYIESLNLYLLSISLLLFIGVLDDKLDLSVRFRLIAQVLISLILILGADLYLTSFGAIFHGVELKLGYLGMIITIIAVVASINAFNMIDGIDGLAGMLSLVSFSSIGFLFHHAGNSWTLIPILFVASILAYLLFNLRWPFRNIRKVFMGDAGSMLIGLTVVWLLIVGVESPLAAFSPVTALYLISVPLMDMAAIMYRRLKKGQSPFKPDREHLHHIFERAGFSRRQTLICITIFSAVLSLIGIVGELLQVAESAMFFSFIILFGAYNWALSHSWTIITWLRREQTDAIISVSEAHKSKVID